MKKYQSHKVVEAGIIAALALDEDGSGVVIVEGVEYDVPTGFRRPGASVRPHAGDYFVRYQPDGYVSWSPRKAFEDGYRPIEVKAATWQERAVLEMNELAERTDKLRMFLLKGGTGDTQADELMRQQYGLMTRYYDALVARLRLVGAIDVETPPMVRDDARANDALGGRVGDLQMYLASGPDLPPFVVDALKTQAEVMAERYTTARMREERGEPAAVEVTVTAPAGRRAHVTLGSMGGSGKASWTVTGGQQQAWSVAPGEFVTVHEGEPHSTVAHKRDAS
jgi:hypothetical protein